MDVTVEAELVSVTVYSHALIAVVVTGGIVSVVVSTILVQPVDADHATSSEVIYGGNVMVVSVGRTSGGKIKTHGGSQLMTGVPCVQIMGSIYTTAVEFPSDEPDWPLPDPGLPGSLEPPPSGVSPLPLPEYRSILQIMVPPKQ